LQEFFENSAKKLPRENGIPFAVCGPANASAFMLCQRIGCCFFGLTVQYGELYSAARRDRGIRNIPQFSFTEIPLHRIDILSVIWYTKADKRQKYSTNPPICVYFCHPHCKASIILLQEKEYEKDF